MLLRSNILASADELSVLSRSCGGHFCFLCAQKLQALNPYKHYNTPGTPCYQKLFHGQAQNEDDLWEPFDEPELVEVA